RSREALALPAHAVREWLRGGKAGEVADVEGVPAGTARPGAGRQALRWRGPDPGESSVVGPEEVRPGDTLVVPADYGGADELGWAPLSARPVPDVGDLCVNEMANAAPADGTRRLLRLRLYGGRGDDLRTLLVEGEDYSSALEE